MKSILQKYGTVENLLKNALQKEKDEFLLDRMAIEVSYDERPLKYQHAVDSFLYMKNLQGHLNYSNIYEFDDNHLHFSMFSYNSFQGKTNLFFPENYLQDVFHQRETFNSINHFFKFHSLLLFLNKGAAKKVLNSYDKSFFKVEDVSQDFNIHVWNNYKIFIMKEGVKSLLVGNKKFETALLNTSTKFLSYRSKINYWGRGKDSLDCNYWGKILTRIKLEKLERIPFF